MLQLAKKNEIIANLRGNHLNKFKRLIQIINGKDILATKEIQKFALIKQKLQKSNITIDILGTGNDEFYQTATKIVENVLNKIPAKVF